MKIPIATQQEIKDSPLEPMAVALLGTCSPRLCGIATFSGDLAASLRSSNPDTRVDCFAMDDGAGHVYPAEVVRTICDQEVGCYVDAARMINEGGYDVLSIQHEFGIYGGEAGAHLLALMRKIEIPIVTTLHTVLQDPSQAQRTVLDEVLRRSSRIVVMSNKAIDLLVEVHQADPEKVSLIHHGIPKMDPEAGKALRASLDIEGPLILTFGLLSPDKGIEYVIEAMPQILTQYPDAAYIIVGATHPHVVAAHGEGYRKKLSATATKLGVDHAVRFVDRFVTQDEIVEWLGAMDIYITPYLKATQITSGTLAYSIGAGKVVISTPYWYAEELLADGRGVFVPFRSAKAIAEAVLRVESDLDARTKMSQAAAAFGQEMLWSAASDGYRKAFNHASENHKNQMEPPERHFQKEDGGKVELGNMRLDHLFAMSDDTGMLQHANFTVPNRAEGYCVDDNARALLFTLQFEHNSPIMNRLASFQGRYLAFVLSAFNPATGWFRNFMSYGRQWLEESGSEDSHGRAMWSLGETVRRSADVNLRDAADSIYRQGVPALLKSTSPRTWTYGILSAEAYLAAKPNDPTVVAAIAEMARRLHGCCLANTSRDWRWFEQSLSYANPRMAQALMLAGTVLNDSQMVEDGLRALDWLAGLQTSSNGYFSPIGTKGLRRGEVLGIAFDQQPIEAWTSVSASLTAHKITKDSQWFAEAHRAFRWFLGENHINKSLYDPLTGGCADGLHADRISRNQGAESTLAYLCSYAEMSAAMPAVRKPSLSGTLL